VLFAAPDEDRFDGVEERLKDGPDCARDRSDIAELEARDARDRDEQLATLRSMRERWRGKAAEESDG
jgi:hypothetical protein